MFKRLFGSQKGRRANGHVSIFEPRMPEVDVLPDIENRFAEVRKAANGEITPPNGTQGRHVIVVTPGRMMMFKACPPSGAMATEAMASIEWMMLNHLYPQACGHLTELSTRLSTRFLGFLRLDLISLRKYDIM